MSGWYLLALGANRRGRHGAPARTIRAALTAVGGVRLVSPVIASAPVGPSIRRFANAVALVDSDEPPPAMLARLKAIERAFGRRARATLGRAGNRSRPDRLVGRRLAHARADDPASALPRARLRVGAAGDDRAGVARSGDGADRPPAPCPVEEGAVDRRAPGQ